MPRTPGALNRPKYISVRLGDLNKLFKDNVYIKISSEYSYLFGENNLENHNHNEESYSSPIGITEIE